MKLKKFAFFLGSVSLGLGTVGIFLPILPTVPFYLLTLFFFANSSQRLHRWFLGTRLYEKHLAPCISGKGMTARTKTGMVTTVTLLMGFGFAMMAWKKIWILPDFIIEKEKPSFRCRAASHTASDFQLPTEKIAYFPGFSFSFFTASSSTLVIWQ